MIHDYKGPMDHDPKFPLSNIGFVLVAKRQLLKNLKNKNIVIFIKILLSKKFECVSLFSLLTF